MHTEPTASNSLTEQLRLASAAYGWFQLSGGIGGFLFTKMHLSKRTRFKVFDRDDYTCRYCGKTPADGITLEADHVIPKSKGGDNSMENLVTSCFDCNRGKSDLVIGGSHEEPSKVAMRRIQEIKESKRLLAEKRKAEKLREKQIQEWTNTICDAFEIESCPERIALDCARHAKEFGSSKVIEWVDKLSGKFKLPDTNANKYLNGIARRVREESK